MLAVRRHGPGALPFSLFESHQTRPFSWRSGLAGQVDAVSGDASRRADASRSAFAMLAERNRVPLWLVAEWLACAAVLLLVYRAVVADLWTVWMTNQDFSHGVLVAPFVLYLGWSRRKVLARAELTPSWLGAGLLLAAFAMRLAGLRYYYGSLERLSLVVAAWGAVLLLGGREVFKNLRGPLALLLLMVPPPGHMAEAITLPLQRMAARSSASVLDAMGWDVIREGNVLRLPLQNLEVAAACSGLRMIFAIVTLGGAMVCLMKRPRWERMVLLASTVPLAIVVNVVRVIATAVLSDTWPTMFSPGRIHDVAGWLMMPVALTLLWLEQRFLRSLFVDPDAES